MGRAKEQLFQLYSPGSIERFIPENDSRIIVGLSHRHPGRFTRPLPFVRYNEMFTIDPSTLSFRSAEA
jgi:hypothetical protein